MSVTVYKNARIFTGSQIVENGIILVSHNHKEFSAPAAGETPVKVVPALSDKIEYVGSAEGCEIPEGAEIIDLTGCTVLPGLIDCAARLDTLNPASDDYVNNIRTPFRTFLAYRSAAEALNVGVTTIHTVGMPNNIDLGLRDAINKTMFFGPSILAAGPTYAVTAGNGHEKYGLVMASGCDALRREMRIHIARGLNGITLQVSGKPMDSLNGEYRKEMSDAEVHALVKHAKGAEKKVLAVANGDPSVSICLGAGIAGILEGRRIGKANLRSMAEKGVHYIPCLVASLGTEYEAEHKSVVAEAIKCGVKIGVGTEILPSEPIDGTVAFIKEMELLVECGMTPAQAIQSATSTAAEISGAKTGILAAGKAPDFIVAAGNPMDDISAMRNIVMVVKSGRRAFAEVNGIKERAFHIMPPGYNVCGGTTFDWAADATKGVIDPANYNDMWNLRKEI